MKFFQSAGRMGLGIVRPVLPVFYILLSFFLVSCHQEKPEDVDLPYAKKKYDPSLWCRMVRQSDSSGHVSEVLQRVSRKDLREEDVLYYAWDDSCRLRQEWSFLAHYLWLQSPSFPAERKSWKEKELASAATYLRSLGDRGYGDPVPFLLKDSSYFEAPSLCHRCLLVGPGYEVILSPDTMEKVFPFVPDTDTTIIHLYYNGNAFSHGLNRTVLMPFHLQIPSYAPSRSFFDEGGILAVVGQAYTLTFPDSSRFHTEADALYQAILEDSLDPGHRWEVYEAFMKDSSRIASLVGTRQEILYTGISSSHLLTSARHLVAGMYSTPSRLALFAMDAAAVDAEVTLLENPGFFGSAVLKMPDSASLGKIWSVLPECGPDSIRLPATLLFADSNHYAFTAFLQHGLERRCGTRPFLMDTGFSSGKAWGFMLYHMGRNHVGR